MATTTLKTPSSYDVTSGDIGYSLTTSTLPIRNEHLVRIEIAVQATIFSLALGGNLLVLISMFAVKRRRKLNRMNMMIAHLSIADISVALFNTLPQLMWDITGKFIGNDFLCRLITFLQLLAMFASSYIMVTTTIDRFLVICYPLSLHQWTRRRILVLVGIAWGLSALFSLPQIFIFSYMEVATDQYTCYAKFSPNWTEKLYVMYVFLAIYVVPLIIITGAYTRICIAVWASTKMKVVTSRSTRSQRLSHADSSNGKLISSRSSGSNSRAHVGGRMAKAKVKTILMTLTVIICYMACLGPFFVAQVWSVFDGNAPFQGAAMVVVVLLPSLNSCANPWIYMAFMNSPLQRLKQLCCNKKPRRSSTMNNDSDTRMRGSTMMSNTEFTRMVSNVSAEKC